MHFAISLAVFVILVALMVVYWFPGNLFFMEGGWDGIKIIAPIDLILGPALTLIFYRPWKKNVRFDMSVIVALQVVALGYGVYTAYGQRTAAIVFAENRFETVSYTEFKAAQKAVEAIGQTTQTIRELGGNMPVIVYAEPFTGEEHREYFESVLNGGPELRERSDRYRLLSALPNSVLGTMAGEQAEEIASNDIPGDIGNASDKGLELDRSDAEFATITEVPAASKPLPERFMSAEELRFDLKARFNTGEIVLDPKTFELLRITPDE